MNLKIFTREKKNKYNKFCYLTFVYYYISFLIYYLLIINY
jgi:hypothetical protein